MGLIKNIVKTTNKLNDKLLYISSIRRERKYIKDHRRVKLYNHVHFTNEQENEIQEYFKKHYGKKIDIRFHKLYQSFTGNFDKKYFPAILFSSKLEPTLSNRYIAKVFTDKSMVELLLKI